MQLIFKYRNTYYMISAIPQLVKAFTDFLTQQYFDAFNHLQLLCMHTSYNDETVNVLLEYHSTWKRYVS